jgi:hypothetical protein
MAPAAHIRIVKTGRRAFALTIAATVAGAVAVALTNPAAAAVSGAPSGRFGVGAGVSVWHERWATANGPESAWVATVNLASHNVHARAVSSGTLGRREAVNSTAARTGASVAINGDFFDRNGIPFGGLVQGGHIVRSPKHGWNAQLSITRDGHARIGPVTFTGAVTDIRSRSTQRLYSVNTHTDATAGQLTQITPAMVPVRINQTCLYAAGSTRGNVLTVAALQRRADTTRLVGTQRALLACSGSARRWLLKHAQRGRTLRMSSHVGGAPQSVISGGRQLLRAGKPFNDRPGMITFGANPETAVCVSGNGRSLLLATVDGRYNTPGGSVGVSMAQLTAFLMAKHCWDALMFDGGGSTTFVARVAGHERLLNRPTDYRGPRPVPDSLVITS